MDTARALAVVRFVVWTAVVVVLADAVVHSAQCLDACEGQTGQLAITHWPHTLAFTIGPGSTVLPRTSPPRLKTNIHTTSNTFGKNVEQHGAATSLSGLSVESYGIKVSSSFEKTDSEKHQEFGSAPFGPRFKLALINGSDFIVSSLYFEAVDCRELTAEKWLFRVTDLGVKTAEPYYALLPQQTWMSISFSRTTEKIVVSLQEPHTTTGLTSKVSFAVYAGATVSHRTRVEFVTDWGEVAWDNDCLAAKSTSTQEYQATFKHEAPEKEVGDTDEPAASPKLQSEHFRSFSGTVTVPYYVIIMASVCVLLVVLVIVLVSVWQCQRNKLRRRRCSHQQQIIRKQHEREQQIVDEMAQGDLDTLRQLKPTSGPSKSFHESPKLYNNVLISSQNKFSKPQFSRQNSENSNFRSHKLDKRLSQASSCTNSTSLGDSSGTITPLLARSKDSVKTSRTDMISDFGSPDVHYDTLKKSTTHRK